MLLAGRLSRSGQTDRERGGEKESRPKQDYILEVMERAGRVDVKREREGERKERVRGDDELKRRGEEGGAWDLGGEKRGGRGWQMIDILGPPRPHLGSVPLG